MFWRDTEFWDVAENEGGPTFSFADDASRVERPIHIRYSDLRLAVANFIGYSYLDQTNDEIPYIKRVVPHHFGGMLNLDGEDWLYCTAVQRADGVSVLSRDPVSGMPKGQLARLRLLYQSLTYNIVEDADPLMTFTPVHEEQENPLAGYPDEATLARYVTRKGVLFTRTITIPQSFLRVELDPGDIPSIAATETENAKGGVVMEGIGKQEGGIDLEYTHWLRPELPLNTIMEALGCINEFLFDGRFPALTLLFTGAEWESKTTPNGQRVYNVKYKFKFLPKIDKTGTPRGHNAFLRFIKRGSSPNHLDYRNLSTTGQLDDDGNPTGERVYFRYDFSWLFRPEA